MALHDPRVLDHDPLTGAVEFFIFDDDTGGFTIETVEDVEPLVELNKALHNSHTDYRRWKGDLHWVAHLPTTVLLELHQKGLMTAGGKILDEPGLKRWLNDRDNMAFRVKPGRV